MTSFLDPLIAFVSANAWLAYLTLFLAALLEAVPVVGSLVPGSTIILALSALVPGGELKLWGVLAAAIAGALLGDGTAFLVGQWLDVTIFDRLRRAAWWRAPLVSTLLGSTVDSAIFFTIAFAASLSFLEPGNDLSWAAEPGALLGIGQVVPFWVSLAVADWCVKFAIAVLGLLPFRLFVAKWAAGVA